jgi:uncharacterized protein (DUF2235 family)
MAIDEYRSDFEPTIWQPRENMDIQQVWFAGAHSNIGGSYKPDSDNTVLSDNSLLWMVNQAGSNDLAIEPHLKKEARPNALATVHNSRRSFYRVKKKFYRDIDHGKGEVLIHRSVRQRWDQNPKYRPKNLAEYIENNGWPKKLA